MQRMWTAVSWYTGAVLQSQDRGARARPPDSRAKVSTPHLAPVAVWVLGQHLLKVLHVLGQPLSAVLYDVRLGLLHLGLVAGVEVL